MNEPSTRRNRSLASDSDTTAATKEEPESSQGRKRVSTERNNHIRYDLDATAVEEEKPNGCGVPSSNLNNKTVKTADPDLQSSSTSSSSSDDRILWSKWMVPVKSYFASHYAWIPQNWTWSKIKPVIRCALAGWLSVVLFLIPKVEHIMGAASFLILIAAFLSPPSDPFIATAEREFLILFLSCAIWAWSCLGIFLADLARRVHVPKATLAEVIDGKYVEAAPSVITAIFIFFGSATLLWIRARQGPGPFLFPCILACLAMDICLTTSALFPYPFYLVGRSFLIPLSLHTGLTLLTSLTIFPSTISALFTSRLSASLNPLLTTLADHRALLVTPLSSPEFAPLLAIVRKDTVACETGLVSLAAAGRLLKSDLIYGRFAPKDFLTFQGMCKRLAGRADGLGAYFLLVDPSRERFPGTVAATPAATAPGTPTDVLSRTNSRVGSESNAGQNHEGGIPISPTLIASRSLPSQGPNQLPLSQVSSRAPSISMAPSHHKHAHSQAYSTTYSHLQLHNSTPHHDHRHQRHHHHSNGHGHALQHGILHSSLLSLARARAKKPEHAVGTFESQKCLNLEAMRLWDPNEDEWNENIEVLLKESCVPLLEACSHGIATAKEWISTVRSARLPEFLASIGLLPSNPDEIPPKRPSISKLLDLLGKGQQKRREERKRRAEMVRRIREVRAQVANALDIFRTAERHAVLEPYRHAFEDGQNDNQNSPRTTTNEPTLVSEDSGVINHDYGDEGKHGEDRDDSNGKEKDGGSEYVMPPPRCLFNCFIYQYNLMQVASIVLEMLDEILRLEEARPECRLWTPVERIFKARWGVWSLNEPASHTDEDDDPDVIQGINRDRSSSPSNTDVPRSSTTDPFMPSKITGPAFPVDSDCDLGLPRRRDPDYLPPRNVFEAVMSGIHKFLLSLGSGNVLFAIKGGLLTVALSLPSLIKHSAEFAYVNQFVWGIFTGQLAIARFRGDTTFALSARAISTFFGAIVGMVMWYISCGSGAGNPYGLAATCAVCFPFFFYGRLYWPIPALRNFIFFVTASLVLGYSYQDARLHLPGNPGYGFPVAWKRFVLVTCGVFAAFIVSFFPPATTIRRYQRNLLATTSAEVGTVYCAILSFANTKHEPEIQEIISTLLAVRNKLARLTALRVNAAYEFSLKGRWPADRYRKIVDLQIAISYSLSHLMSVLEHLDPAWSRAFLRRTRFMDPDFQGDVLAVISMISFALRTGSPLPQITPCPLVDRFMLKYHGLNVIHKDSEEDYGLPRTLSIDTLKNEQYLMFSVGIATAFSIVGRLDRLMVAVKEIVGEQYHIHGVGVVRTHMAPGYGGSLGMSAALGARVGGGIEMGSRTSTGHFDPPGQV